MLGGGGARGAAHIGMIKSITEAGIPIDKVGMCLFLSIIQTLFKKLRVNQGLRVNIFQNFFLNGPKVVGL